MVPVVLLVLSLAGVSGLKLIWKSKLNNDSYSLFALTAPVVAGGVAPQEHRNSLRDCGGWSVEDRRRRWKALAEALGEIGIDSLILFFQRDG